MRRCYGKRKFTEMATYHGCMVNPEWHDFQRFAEWYKSQPNSVDGNFALDKDLIKAGNKEYGPENCSLVPQEINNLLLDSGAARGSLPIGVTNSGGNFKATISVKNKHIHLGFYTSPTDAHNAYKSAKVHHVRQIAEEYKSVLHPKVYENLRNWTL